LFALKQETNPKEPKLNFQPTPRGLTWGETKNKDGWKFRVFFSILSATRWVSEKLIWAGHSRIAHENDGLETTFLSGHLIFRLRLLLVSGSREVFVPNGCQANNNRVKIDKKH